LGWVGLGRLRYKYYILWELYSVDQKLVHLHDILTVVHTNCLLWLILNTDYLDFYCQTRAVDSSKSPMIVITNKPYFKIISLGVCYIKLGWVKNFQFTIGWVGLGHTVNKLGLGRIMENGSMDNSVFT